MSKATRIKIAALTGMVGAAAANWPSADHRTQAAWMAFGAFNLLVTGRVTPWIRGAAAAGAFTALVAPDSEAAAVVMVCTWILWPPCYLMAAHLATEPGWSSGPAPAEPQEQTFASRAYLASLIGAGTIASLAYRALVSHGLQQTAALFIGLPALIAIVVVLTVTPRSATGVACKAVTVGLLASSLFLWEGFLCIVMAAPLFYAVAIAVAGARDTSRGKLSIFSKLSVLLVVPMSLEGVTPLTTVNRSEVVTAHRLVRATPDAIAQAMFQLPRFDRLRPAYLRAGFPSPLSTRIEQENGTTRWVIQMRGGEMLLDGMESKTGDLILALEESRPGMMRWRAISDTSHVTHFLTFREAIVNWEPVDGQTTRVTWTIRFDRGLDPAWYFGPMERYAAKLAAGYLIDTVATP